MDRRFGLTMDAAQPRELGAFWAFALGYEEEPPPEPFATWDEALTAWGLPREQWGDFYALRDPQGSGPRLFFQRVPEAKTAKNRLHVDVGVPGSAGLEPRPGPDAVRAHAEALVARGAMVLSVNDDPAQGFWVVMADPEGNEFCVV